MAKATKFGTFAGVFTPSILTILGVIMYLRLGWVVGEGGLIMTIGIILLAHIISISTGLSISSIATDKKIKTGGIYYILSRSLGLPMGGAIGITLFIGTALSIALYIVGFTENMLEVFPQISNFIGFSDKINIIRLIGTIVIVILVILAFISTSLVIKTQYFILGAIALSLVSIALGFFLGGGNETGEIILSKASEESSFEDLFKVFFPAVTGFTAGVAMSGDLANPKKSIPVGTMASIIVGFIVYITLAFGIAYFVDRELLLTDTNFLMQIAWFAPLVMFGIWGATLSSALGGILGGPRILQAIANDKILPGFLGKGYGASNEPRTALFVIFIIAEIGILIGELNIIAGVVSMFYLASYGFINLAFSLESWASTDFRPSFKVNPWFGIIGFIASFAIMFKLDTISMFAALIIMSLIFLALKRKEFKTDAGDVWQSVWTSIVRNALHKMEKSPMEERNWQPNIILFSGGTSRRPYLVEFGKNLVGKFGMLSNFDLIEKSTSDILFPKHEQALKRNGGNKGIFYRRQTCKDIYQGIEVIASTYGFSGIEPNTVLMGWARQSSDPVKFGTLIRNLYKLDLNVLLMDYDKRFGFGNKKSIDIWWRGEGHNNNLALFLAKLMLSGNEWENAKIRLLIVSSHSEQNEKLYEKANLVLENLRIIASVKIINNQLDTRHVYDIISDESKESSMVFLGIPEIEVNQEEEFIKKTNKLLGDIGTVVLVKASSLFMNQKFNSAPQKQIVQEQNIIISDIEKNIPAIERHNVRIDFIDYLNVFFEKLNQLSERFKQDFFEIPTKNLTENIKQYTEKIKGYFNNLNKIDSSDYKESEQLIENIYEQSNLFLEEISEITIRNAENHEKAIKYFQNEITAIVNEMPENVFIKFDNEELKDKEKDTKELKKYKRKVRLVKSLKGGEAKSKIKFKRILSKKAPFIVQNSILSFIEKWDSHLYKSIADINKIVQALQFILPPKASELSKYSNAIKINESELKTIYELLKDQNNTESILNSQLEQLKKLLDYNIEEKIIKVFTAINLNIHTSVNKSEKSEIKLVETALEQLPDKWNVIYSYFFSEIKLDNVLGKTKIRLFQILQWYFKEINSVTEKFINTKANKLIDDINELLEEDKAPNQNQEAFATNQVITREELLIYDKLSDKCKQVLGNMLSNIPEKFELLEDIIFSDLSIDEIKESKSYTVMANRLAEGIITTEINSLFAEITTNLINNISKIDNEIINQNRLIKYSIFQDGNESEQKVQESIDFENFLKNRLDDAQLIIDNSNKSIQEAFLKLLEGFYNVNEKLQLYSFKKEANSWNQFLPTTSARNSISSVKNLFNTLGNLIDKQIDEFWYRQSDAVLLADKITTKSDNEITTVFQLLNLCESASPSKKAISELPFYYKHLFLDKKYYNNDFWVGRENELERAKTAFRRFKDGYSGALLISGERNSGKSFFIRHLCSKHLELKKEPVFIKAPAKNAHKSKELLKSLQVNLEKKGDFSKIFKTLESGSVIVFEDIELWWEKSEFGNESLKKIFELIDSYGSKVFFIFSINSFSNQILKKIIPFESLLLDSISLRSINTKTLQEIILFRHRASGIKFELDKKSMIGGKSDEEDFKTKHFALLFSKYFNNSDGNIGVCILSWVANIISCKDNKIIMKLPSSRNSQILEGLDNSKILILYQFILHKKMTVDKLARIMLSSEDEMNKQLEFLLRAGLVKKDNILYDLNQFVINDITELLSSKNIL